jgi:GNAT superfamily N-acetyltransferase
MPPKEPDMSQAPPSSYRIRNMELADLELAVEWAAREGWNPGLNDARMFFAADPQGFFLGELDGRPVAFISAVAYDQTFGFGGFYIVDPEFRGQGLGLALTQHALGYLGDRIIGLDGVVAQQENYAKLGWAAEFTSLRCQTMGGGAAPNGLSDLAGFDFSKVAAYDAGCFPAARAGFLREWVNYPGGAALGVEHDGELKGYGVIRPCRQGMKIGPLFANDPDVADRLFLGLAAAAPGQTIYLDVPQNNPDACELAKRHGMEPVFETARMYKNGRPAWVAAKVYGITTFELG